MTATLAALMFAFTLPALAGTSPNGAGRKLSAPADPTFEPVLRDIEVRLPAYEDLTKATVRVPAMYINLGESNKDYKCWKLRLTGDNGKQARGVLESLLSVQDAVKTLHTKLLSDLVLLAANSQPDPKLQERIVAEYKSLDALLTRYDSLIELGERNKLIDSSGGGLFDGWHGVTPRLKKDDYTMVYDETPPGCLRKRNKDKPSGV